MKAIICVFALLVLFNAASAKYIRFALDFKGNQNGLGNHQSSVVLKAPGQIITTKISATYGVDMATTNLIGTKADWNSFVSFNNNDTIFTEAGKVTFGTHLHNEHVIYFQTDAPGHVYSAPNHENELRVASATFRISGGEGAFQGATGTLVASYTYNESDPDHNTKSLVVANFWVPDSDIKPKFLN